MRPVLQQETSRAPALPDHSRHCASSVAHEQQLLAGIAPHEAEIGGAAREAFQSSGAAALRDAADQRRLAVHHLVMAERSTKFSVKAYIRPKFINGGASAVDRIADRYRSVSFINPCST
jgi:hypothetical protein